MKIQPVDPSPVPKGPCRTDQAKPVAKSRFKRLFERQFPGFLRVSSAEKLAGGGVEHHCSKEGCSTDLEPSSVCLAKMVQNFLEESNEKQAKCNRNRCNCFNGNCSDSSDDELDLSGGTADGPAFDACEILKSLVPCSSVSERNLLADTAKIVEKNKICKRKDDCGRIVTDGLSSLGYDASICRSRWEKSPSFPAGEYEYVDVMVEGERLLIDIDFKSEFETARSTKNYRAILQSLPSIFVGKPDRLQQIVSVVCEAAEQSLKKKGLHFPPWRKPEYMRAKWLSPYQRLKPVEESQRQNSPCAIKTRHFSGEFELIFGEKNSAEPVSAPEQNPGEEKITVVVSPWQLPAIKPRASGEKIVTGLASLFRDKP
ncbi:hypothetical protein MRB53_003458 [Persea americana]|uniref:Uncharacterized protein n=1 Tax=Persea americana TaxID=3435 RepID=A0ACC2MYA7_PERAE|nr:hypothetical protein MRB53_003458 [Persea americana]|eukprot:TRINITY_DN221_c0_g1_i2.p1 TRINITY_DN221_c0_g1~~TRINITY_DN221_c0_g1_i2.p1  ORF type:complete len:371 (+),score=29.39 TRINITY_DN221_c0_g1_i2:789-1901(+)